MTDKFESANLIAGAARMMSNKCPKCGSEMYQTAVLSDGILVHFWYCKCGHEEKVKP